MSALFANVLTASFHGSIVIGAVLLLRLILRKAPKKYICWLWLLAGIRLLMPFEIQSDLSLQPQSPPETVIRWEQPAPMRLDSMENLHIPESQPLSPEVPAATQEEAAPAETVTVEPSFSWKALIPFLWIGVAAAFILSSLISYVNLRRKVRDAVKIPGGWESGGIETAFILGFVKPRIYIPVGMAPVTRKHILAHERTHLDKGDHWIKMIGFLALALHWFNPLVWIAYILLCKDIEMACDERVVQFMELSERKEYSTALLNCSTNRIHYAASPVAFGEVSVKSRIQSILNYRKPSFWAGLLSVMAIAFVTVCLVTSPTQVPEATVSVEPKVSEAAFSPAEPMVMAENPDWGLGMVADVHSSTSMTLYYGVNVEDIPWDGTALYKDRPYFLEKWNGESWEALPQLVSNPSYDDIIGSIELSKDNAHSFYTSDEIDWSLLYGELPQGDYRIGIYITRNGEIKPHYAWFHIYAAALTGEEAEAVAKCEKAMDLLTQGYSYACLISESTEQGTLVPVMDVRKGSRQSWIDYYYGEHCYGSVVLESTSTALDDWADVFRLNENKHISFPQGESLISQEEIRFVTQWTDLDGNTCKEYNTYLFDDSGKLSSVDRLTQHEEDGVLVQSRRQLTVRDYYATGHTYSGVSSSDLSLGNTDIKDSWEAAEESPWNIHFRVDDDLLTGTGGEVWLSLMDTAGISNYTTDGTYWLERKNDKKWEKLPASGEPTWGSETYRLKSSAVIVEVDWSAYYGKLSSGHYRMGKHFYCGEESIIQYAEFLVYPEGGITGEGAEEALARVDAALDKLRNGNYHIVQERTGGFRGDPEIDTVYWKYDGICVTDYYDFHRGDGYSHSTVNTAHEKYAYLFYDAWMSIMNWREEGYQVYFSDSLSVISDREVSFAVGSTRYADPALNYYSFFFDEDGNITRMEWDFKTIYDSDNSVSTYTVQKTSDAEIQTWVEKIQSENPA